MAKTITIKVKGTDHGGNDAPTVMDLLSQIQDHVTLMQDVEKAIAPDGKRQLEWRVTNVSMNSPIAFEITPDAKDYGTDIETHAKEVVVATARGLASLRDGKDRPHSFTDDAIRKTEKISRRVTNGLASTEVDFSEYEEQVYHLDHETAHRTVATLSKMTATLKNPHRELGSIEGFVKSVGRDGHGRPLIHLTGRFNGNEVKCIGTDGGLDRIGRLRVDQIMRGLRIRVFGNLHYKATDTVDRVDVDRAELFANEEELPGLDDIVEPNFTNGVEAVEYLKILRADG